MTGSLLAAVALAAAPALRPAEPAETLVRLTVSPAAAPTPALRYLLLPDLREQTPGNAIPNYLKCFFDLEDAAKDEVLTRAALRQADRAARMGRADWDLLPKLREDGFNTLLPDVQKVRALAAGLQGRFREEVADSRFDDAVATAKTMFALSRHTGEHPSLIGDLVGIAIAQVAIAPLDELLERPGCPNLYWALTALPAPFVPLDRGVAGERVMVDAETRTLSGAAPMTAGQVAEFCKRMQRFREFEDGKAKKRKTVAKLVADRAADKARVAAARTRLAAAGLDPDRLARFPAAQVILLDEKRECEERRDELTALVYLPVWEAEAAHAKLKPTADREENALDVVVPNLVRVRRASARLDQRLALLRHVEAVRLYAAAHGGDPPDRLADVGVPLPPDPMTGKPFRYARDGATAHLRGTPPRGDEGNAAFNVHYEVTIRKPSP